MASMLEFRTPGFNPYAVKYSPYYDSRVAVASAANYGIVGNGRLFVLGLGPQGIRLDKAFDTNDAQYDLAWSEINENQLLAACGDGSVKCFDASADHQFPVANFHEHKREAFSVAWAPLTKDTFASSSWDGTVKILGKNHPVVPARTESLKTLPVGSCAYSTAYCPSNPHIVSCASSDSHLRVFDLRTPVSSAYHLTAKLPVHHASPPARRPRLRAARELLTHDWNKYRDTVVAVAGVDRAVRTFDLRMAPAAAAATASPAAPAAPQHGGGGGPLSVMLGHEYAVRRLAWSPHAADVLLTASYDMTVRLWTDGSTMGAAGAGAGDPVVPSAAPMATTTRPGLQLGVMNRHTEFVTGVDWCLFGVGGWVATVGWDERLLLWDANTMLQR